MFDIYNKCWHQVRLFIFFFYTTSDIFNSKLHFIHLHLFSAIFLFLFLSEYFINHSSHVFIPSHVMLCYLSLQFHPMQLTDSVFWDTTNFPKALLLKLIISFHTLFVFSKTFDCCYSLKLSFFKIYK